jgi:hypothetical protein
MSVCVYSVCCPVEVAALRRADQPSEKSNRLSVRFVISELILYGNRPHSLIRQCRKRRRTKPIDV